MGGFVGSSDDGELVFHGYLDRNSAKDKERRLRLEMIEMLTSRTHHELLTLISDSTPLNTHHVLPAETPNTGSLNREELSLASSPPSPSHSENAPQQSSAYDPSPQELSPNSASPQYRILITEAVIRDKSKTNAITKLITVTQTTWFIVQFIERWATHQPRTQLEVMTVAYAALNVIVYALLWNKPYSVDEPINISGRAPDDLRIRTTGVWGPDSIKENAWSLMMNSLETITGEGTKNWATVLLIVFPVAGALFGGLHCFAWQYHFPTEQEAILWRICAVYCTVAPVAALALAFLFESMEVCSGGLDFQEYLARFFVVMILVGYVVARLILLALTFSCLRGLPAGIFETTTWIKFIPHIS